MKKFTKIMAAATAFILTLGVAGCSNGSGDNSSNTENPPKTYASFINAPDSGDTGHVSEKYVVNVLSEGGMPLSGVKIAAKRNNEIVRRGISKEGKIEFAVSLGEYELEIDETSLPAGYSLVEGETYKTNPEKREEVTIKIPSRLLSSSATVDSYAPGNIMRDFTFTDCGDGQSTGQKYTLSTLLETKKAVVLNFFYTTCNPCRAEFPHIYTAYNNRTAKDIEFLAICTTSMGDTNQSVANFRSNYNLNGLPMGIDRIGICSAFGVTAYPTTVVIDRYGMIAYRTSGGEPTSAFWTGLFDKYAADDYTQSPAGSTGSSDNENQETDRKKPTETMPASAVLEQAALDEHVSAVFTGEDDDEYSWPWLAGNTPADGDYIYSSNKGVGNSYSTVHAEIDMKEGEVLSFQYKVSTEANADYLYVLLDGDPMDTGYSGESDWTTVNLYVADRDKKVKLTFIYLKDPLDPETGVGDDVVKIRNISLADANNGGIVKSLDVMRSCASGEVKENKYSHYVDYVYSDPATGGDGFYHKDSVDGPLIYMTINQLTPWSELHTDDTAANTIFRMTESKYVESVKDENSLDPEATKLVVNIGGKDVTEAYTVYVLIMGYMPAPFYLIPVTENLKGWAEALIADFEKGNQHSDEWLEFCYYYDHYGAKHDDKTDGDGLTCKVDEDYTRGVTKYNAYYAYEKDDPELENSETYNAATKRNRAIINFPLQLVQNGTYYRFTAKEAGVYQIRSYTEGCSPSTEATADNTEQYVAPEPKILIYDNAGNFLKIAEEVLDHDAYKGVEYEGFNTYITLEAGQELFLYLGTTSATKSYYDFEISYLGETYRKMMVASTGGGSWTYYEEQGATIWTYLGIDVLYDDLTDCYYAVGADGKIDKDQPVYIDMLYSSFFRCNIEKYVLATLKAMIEDEAFENYMYHGEDYQPIMNEALGKSTDGKEVGDALYGLVPASKDIVDTLNLFINQNVDGGMGEGNGWLAFAVYNAKLGK
ncbi:MAG: TlpA family protein disulfide reductase [Roseburia sp.]|nr:TlpA family protein disulfide reductase [Roseburia sp.]